ncbi:MAG: hypothetical protein GXP45_02460 [bacterium]|nr:hypothetical protein [bacterium]
MKELDPDMRKKRGQELSQIKDTINTVYQKRFRSLQNQEINQQLQKDLVEIGIPTEQAPKGHFSLLAKARREIEDICKSFGFTIEYGNEVVSKFENFEAVNIPLTHPATEMHDTIYLKEKDPNGEGLILRTHTSAFQNQVIKKYGAPLRVVLPAKVYRYEDVDATHDTMFYQLE